MDVDLFVNRSAPNVVDKKITNKKSISGVRFKEENALNVVTPSILLQISNEVSDCFFYNYVYIPKFTRYYYVDNISADNGLVRIDCRCDVLMSFKNDIYNSNQYVLRQENKYKHPYLQDNLLPISSNHNYYGVPFGNDVDDRTCGRIILITAGKGGTVV